MDCRGCKQQGRLQHEAALAIAERTIRRLWITVLVLIGVMACMCIAFFVYESQFTDEVYVIEQDVDTGEGAAVISGIGDAIYGEGKTESSGQDTDY